LTLFESGTYTHSMNTRRVLVAPGLVAAALAILAAHLTAQAIERSMYVSVVNEAGAPVPDLGPADFVVREDNVAREVLRVVPATEPMQIAVLIDTSQTARNDITYMRTALPPFVTALVNPNEGGAKNDVALVAFGERPTIFTDYTTKVADLQKGINRIWSQQDSGAYLLDALIEVTKGFKKREARRPVIVAIVTEGPELSYRQYDQVLEPLRDSGAPFYALMIGTPSGDISDEGRSRSIVVDRGPTETGGRRDQLLSGMALTDRLKQLATQLTHQYRVTYARPQSLIPPERVTVSTPRAGLIARGILAKERQDRP
jgi:von Willebrand factor type A domain